MSPRLAGLCPWAGVAQIHVPARRALPGMEQPLLMDPRGWELAPHENRE